MSGCPGASRIFPCAGGSSKRSRPGWTSSAGPSAPTCSSTPCARGSCPRHGSTARSSAFSRRSSRRDCSSIRSSARIPRRGWSGIPRSLLPLKSGRALRVYLLGISSDAATHEGWTVVADPLKADVAIMRLTAPFERLHPQYVFGQFFHEGSLAFKDGDPDFEAFKRVSAVVPTIVTVYLDRPAILTPLQGKARALIANFGVSDAALIDVLTGRARPQGKLPFELPSSMKAVAAQRSDVPHDSPRPLYPFGFGRSY